MRKPKSNRGGGSVNLCQTPPYALDPLLPYLPKDWRIWEPAAGDGYLAQALRDGGIGEVIEGDVLRGQDFFSYQPAEWDGLVTNPPFNPNNMKGRWIERCYLLGKPWAMLMPVDTIGSKAVQQLFDRHGIEIIHLDHRVNFKMPNKSWAGKSQFATCWYTWGLGIGRQMTFAHVNYREPDQLPLFTYANSQLALFEVTA